MTTVESIPDTTAAPVPTRAWWALVIIGLVGQMAWVVENMYLNLFVYDTITDNPATIATMVAASAVTATLATLFVGAVSDRVAKRRIFIVAGYLLWGVATASFGFVTVEDLAGFVAAANAAAAAALVVIILDCVMTFFGSSANDAAFNAWVTDVTSVGNRGRVEGVLAVMPLLAMLVVFGGLDGLTRSGNWQPFFLTVGAIVIVTGLLALVLIRDVPGEPRQAEGVLRSIAHGLRPSSVRAQPDLYLTLSALAILGVSTQVFLPFLLIYLQNYLRIEAYALVLAVVLLGASAVSVLGGRIIDRVGKIRFILPAAAVYGAGLVGIFFARGLIPVILAGLVMMSGFMLQSAAIGASVRDFTPPDRTGAVQGVRMIAFVLIPMVIGPFIGAAVISGADETYIDLGQVRQVPTPAIFLAALAVVVLIVVPVRALLRRNASPTNPGLIGHAAPPSATVVDQP